MTTPSNWPSLFLDTCCALSLYATNRMVDILTAMPMRCALAQKVEAEMLFVYRGGAGQGATDKDPVDLQPLYAAGLLTVVSPSTATEFARYVTLAAEVDDGEAMTLALALSRGVAISTDDKKARRVFTREAPHLALYRAVDLVHDWSVSQQITGAALREALVNGYERAGFRARPQDPLFGWWSRSKV